MDILRSIGITLPVIQFMMVNAILGLSIYITLYTGMFSLANAGFMAIGAYTGVILTQEAGMPLWVGLAGGMILAGLIAIPIGLPVLRLHDIYLAIATIGFGEVVRILILNFDTLASSVTGQTVELTRRALGMSGIPVLTQTWHLFLFLILAGYFVARLHQSRFGRAMAAIRQDERAASNMGINVVYVKVTVFTISAMLAAPAGCLSAHLTRTISPNGYNFNEAVEILAFAVLGGTGSWVGGVVGDMTALENLLIGQHGRGRATVFEALVFAPSYRRKEKQLREHALALLERFELGQAASIRAGTLPYGDQRRLEMTRALATNPKMQLLDEPTAGMNPVETHQLGEQILRQRESGLTALVIEHDMSLIHQVCDEVYVLNFGQIIAHGTPDEIKANPLVIEAYLGEEEADGRA